MPRVVLKILFVLSSHILALQIDVYAVDIIDIMVTRDPI